MDQGIENSNRLVWQIFTQPRTESGTAKQREKGSGARE